ncbi:hypothetical protein WH47_06997 [Habropoda laboriosa]|uniref:Uncharacterized protein n=1 Tax=Habropoda laboriosa TaxID=597456 RepID=A0A0L7QRS2_9HYME|nr:hypothetical protein WH47_06997 [Habropoda laboriosa]
MNGRIGEIAVDRPDAKIPSPGTRHVCKKKIASSVGTRIIRRLRTSWSLGP